MTWHVINVNQTSASLLKMMKVRVIIGHIFGSCDYFPFAYISYLIGTPGISIPVSLRRLSPCGYIQLYQDLTCKLPP